MPQSSDSLLSPGGTSPTERLLSTSLLEIHPALGRGDLRSRHVAGSGDPGHNCETDFHSMRSTNPAFYDFFKTRFVAFDLEKIVLFEAADARCEFLLAVDVEAIVLLDLPQ